MKMTRLIKVWTAIALMALPTTLNAQIEVLTDNFNATTSGVNDDLATRQAGTAATIEWKDDDTADSSIIVSDGVLNWVPSNDGGPNLDSPAGDKLFLGGAGGSGGAQAQNLTDDLFGKAYTVSFRFAMALTPLAEPLGTAQNDRIGFFLTTASNRGDFSPQHIARVEFDSNGRIALTNNSSVPAVTVDALGALTLDGTTFNTIILNVDEVAKTMTLRANGSTVGTIENVVFGLETDTFVTRRQFFMSIDDIQNAFSGPTGFDIKLDDFSVSIDGEPPLLGTSVFADNFDAATAGLNDDLATRQSGNNVTINGTSNWTDGGWTALPAGVAEIAPTGGDSGTGGLRLAATMDTSIETGSGTGLDLAPLTLFGNPNFSPSGLGSKYAFSFDVKYDFTGGFGGFADGITFRVSTDAAQGNSGAAHFIGLTVHNGGGLNLGGNGGAVTNVVGNGIGILVEDGATFNRIRLVIDENAGTAEVFVNDVSTITADVAIPVATSREIRVDGRANSVNIVPKVYDLTFDNLALEALPVVEDTFAVDISVDSPLTEVTLTFPSNPDDIFDIYRTTDLNAGFGDTPYEPDYTADGGSETIFIDSALPPGGRAFYRVVRQ